MSAKDDPNLREYKEVLSRLRAAEERQRIERVKACARDGMAVRATAEAMGVDKMTAMRYRRKAGLTPPPPLRHLGGGRWTCADDDDGAPRRPFSKGRRGR